MKLEGNCDFLSNNNAWNRFYAFFVGHFEFCWVTFLMTDCLEFVHGFFGSHFEFEF